jgi:hypothetical protein
MLDDELDAIFKDEYAKQSRTATTVGPLEATNKSTGQHL